jgi:hypothetical protein
MASQLDQKSVGGVDGATFRLYTFVGSYSDAGFPTIAQLWQSLEIGDPQAAHRQAQQLETSPGAPAPDAVTAAGAQRQPNAPSPADNTLSAYLAYICNDTDWPEELASYQHDVEKDRKHFPLYGAATANINPCAFWHNDPVDPPLAIDHQGPRNVLVIQNLRDPGTPHLGGQIARKAFGNRARLVSVDDGGHGAYVFGDNACALNTGTNFLLDGRLPNRDLFCRASAG